MTCYTCISLSGFYANHHEPRTVIHRDKLVLDAGEVAQEHGVHPGMGLAEARATYGEGKYVPYEANRYRASRDDWLDRCAEVSNEVEPEQDHIAYLDLSRHPDPLYIAEQLSDRIRFPCSIAISPTKWVARLATDRTPPGQVRLVDDPASYLAPLPVRDLTPVRIEHRQRLDFLGYRTIGQAAHAPPAALRRQFGEDALRILLAAKGGLTEPVHALYPLDALADDIRFPGGTLDMETLRRGLLDLARRLSALLVERDLQGMTMRLIVEREDSAPFSVERRFSRPLQSIGSTTAAIQALFSVLPIDGEAEVHWVRARLPNLVPTPPRQRSLLGIHFVREHHGEACREVELVRSSLPDGMILRASEMKQTRRQRVLRAWRDATGWF